MAGTITLRTDAELDQALDVLTRDGSSRAVVVRQAIIEAAARRERAVVMRRAVLRMPLGELDGVDVGAQLAYHRADERH